MSRRLLGTAKLAVAAALGASLVGGVSAFGTDSGDHATAPEPPNLGKAKLDVQEYYGDYLDPEGNHHASPDSPWAKRVDRVVADAKNHLEKRLADGVDHPAIVLDVDDTSMLTYGWEADNDFGFDEEKQRKAIENQVFEPIQQTRELANWAKQRGVEVYFLTGRGESLADPSLRNLAQAGFPRPDGAFFKPEENAPDYLPCGLECDTVQYKSGTRKHIESQGNTIVLNIGDQDSDLTGGHADKAVKLPNPMYYLP